MKSSIFKIVSIFIIAMFCSAPLSAIDLNQDNITKDDAKNNTDFISINDTVDDSSNEEIENINDTVDDTDICCENDTVNNEWNASQNQLSKSSPHLRASITDVNYGESPVVEVHADERLYARIALDCPDFKYHYKVIIKDGYAKYQIRDEDLKAGVYDVKVSTIGDKNFDAEEITTRFTVHGYDPNLNIRVDDIKKGQKAVAVVTANNTLNGKMDVKLNGSSDVYPVDVVNGRGTVTIDEDLAIGEYTATVSFDGGGPFLPSSKSAAFKVKGEIDPDLDIKVDDVRKGQKAIAVVTANNTLNGKMEVMLNGSSNVYPVDVVDGAGNVTIDEDLPLGEYTATVIYNGDVTFLESTKYTAFKVKDNVNPDLDIKVDNVTKGQKAVAVVTANNTLNCKMDVKLNGSSDVYHVDVVKGNGNVTIDKNLTVGEYTATLSYEGDDTFMPSNKSTTFTVGADPNLNITIDDIYLGQKAVAVIKANETLSGYAKISLSDFPANMKWVYIKDGNANATIELPYDLPAGEYTVNVIFQGDDTFLPSSSSATFTVHEKDERIDPDLNIKVDDIYVGQNSVAVVTANNTLNGKMNVKLNGSSDVYPVDVVNGKGNVTIDEDLAVGEYVSTVSYAGDKTFMPSNKSTAFTVKDKVDPNLDIKVDDVKKGQKAVAVVTANNTLNGKMEVMLNGSSNVYPVDVVNGKGNVTIDEDLAVGEYTATLSYEGDDTFMPSNKSTTFTVKDRIKKTILHVTSKNIKYGEEETIGFTLTDIDGNNITGSIDANIGNNSQSVDIVNGVGTLKIKNLTAGNYSVMANYAGNENYASSKAFSKFYVAKIDTKIICKDMTTTTVDKCDGRVGEWFNWTLVDENGNSMENVPMEIGFNGVVYDEKNGIVTDENGNAKLQINLGYKGTYAFDIAYLGDENHNPSFAESKITVNEQTPTLTVPNKSYKTSVKDKQLTATFKSSRGNPIAGKRITFTVNGKSYTATTNSQGVATVNLNLNTKGSYTFTAKFAGDKTYQATSQTAKLTLK